MGNRPFQLEFDFSTEGVRNAWEAHAITTTEAQLDTAEVWSVEYIADAPNGWPILRITFASLPCARAYVSVYLGLGRIGEGQWDAYKEDEVGEFVMSGRFVD
jgi:hypothetical protein